MPKAIRIQQQGGPEVLKWEDVQVGDPGPGEARAQSRATGSARYGQAVSKKVAKNPVDSRRRQWSPED